MAKRRLLCQSKSPTDVEYRGALRSRTQRHPVEPPFVIHTEFPCSFGDIQRYGRASPLELVAKMGSTSRKTLYDIVRECQELDRRSVDVKSLVIEVGPARRPSGYGNGNGYVYVYGRVILAAMLLTDTSRGAT